MNTRTILTVAGMAAGATVGATSLYVAMKPKLRRNLRKKGFSKDSLSLLGREMKHEAEEVAQEMRHFMAEEAKAASRLPRRWFRRRVVRAIPLASGMARASDEALKS
jgi:hypothetical protein